MLCAGTWEVELFLLEPNYYRDLEISQPKTVTIAPKEMVRYKAKVYCKHNLKGKTLNLQAHVRLVVQSSFLSPLCRKSQE